MKKTIVLIVIMIWAIPSFVLASGNIIFNIYDIVGKSEQQISKMFGPPTSRDMTKYGPQCIYKNEIEIIFINDRADWITINNMGDALFHKNSLYFLGITPVEPTINNKDVMRWDNFSIVNLRQVAFFPSDNKIFYVYIKAFTK